MSVRAKVRPWNASGTCGLDQQPLVGHEQAVAEAAEPEREQRDGQTGRGRREQARAPVSNTPWTNRRLSSGAAARRARRAIRRGSPRPGPRPARSSPSRPRPSSSSANGQLDDVEDAAREHRARHRARPGSRSAACASRPGAPRASRQARTRARRPRHPARCRRSPAGRAPAAEITNVAPLATSRLSGLAKRARPRPAPGRACSPTSVDGPVGRRGGRHALGGHQARDGGQHRRPEQRGARAGDQGERPA